MTNDEFRKLVEDELQRRDRSGDPAERWRVIQETITWLDSQQPVPRNSREGCMANEAKLLEGLVEYAKNRAS